jgi:hypothetical protein
MEWIAGLDFVNLANGIVIIITGLAVGLGFRSGRKNPSHQQGDETVALAGALVDSSSIRHLAHAITKQAEESEALRSDNERLRKVGHEMVEALNGVAKEVMELRREMQMQRR